MESTDSKPTLDDFAIKIINRTARQVSRKVGLRCWDRDDIAQELTVRLLQRMPKFDPQRGHWRAFVTAVVDRQAKSLLRDYRRKKRDDRNFVSLSELVDDGEGGLVELGDTICDGEQLNYRGCQHKEERDEFEASHDVNSLTDILPSTLRDICERLQQDSPAQVARDLGMSRYEMKVALRELRDFAESAGLDGK
ncbi:MAG: sigma-70 family RNA polymerase sigma factor [Gemmataceae bacterium]